ncbi:MAG: hypothetical protein AB1656_22490 [Candidatus Omnitrophota bacterium]
MISNSPAAPVSAPSFPLKQKRRKKWKRRILWFALFLLVCATFVFLGPASWLTQWLLVYETPLRPADVILVGGAGASLDTAVEYCKTGFVKAILIVQGTPERYRGVDAPVSINHFIRQDLRQAGIPGAAVYSVEKESHSLLESQRQLRRFMVERGFRSYICFPPDYASRFTKILHEQTFPEKNVEAVIIPSGGKRVFRKHLLGIQNTLIRWMYWQIVYCPQMREEIAQEEVLSISR